MICFAFQNPDIEPLEAPGGKWFASVRVARQIGLMEGYSWRGPGAQDARRDAIQLAKRHLEDLSPPGPVQPLLMLLARLYRQQ